MARTTYPNIVFFGDSITEYAFNSPLLSNLSNDYRRMVDIFARGFAGYNTNWALPLLEPILASTTGPIEAVVIFFGTNDASIAQSPQHVPLNQYQNNLEAMIQVAQRYTDKVIVVGTTIIDELGTHPGCVDRLNDRSRIYNKCASQAAAAKNAYFLNLWSAFRRSNSEDPSADIQELSGTRYYTGSKSVKHLLVDGIHFTAEGYTIWYDELVMLFKQLGIAPSDYSFVVPAWRELPEVKNHTNVATTEQIGESLTETARSSGRV